MVVAVTDGEASHPRAQSLGLDVASTRAREAQVALKRLACGPMHVLRLGLPDGAVSNDVSRLTSAISDLLRPSDLCLTPWRSDGHPDHNATGGAAVAAAHVSGTPVLEYPIWAWHWSTPEDPSVPWPRCRRLDLSRRQVARKRWATSAFVSQIRPCGSEARTGPVLSDSVLRRFWRPFEMFIEVHQ
jgi:LmbE family N-acetylglucosaminyl deacetylase